MSGGKRRKGRRSARRTPTAWQRSASFRYVARTALAEINAKRGSLPKCGAKCRSGDRCRNLAMANGKCWRHGGRTPSGSQWGRRQVPRKPYNRQTPSDWRKFEKKLKVQEAKDRDSERRLAKMTHDQFEAYVRRMGRRLVGKLGDIVGREIARRRPLLQPEPLPKTNPEIESLQARIDELRALQSANSVHEGVFE